MTESYELNHADAWMITAAQGPADVIRRHTIGDGDKNALVGILPTRHGRAGAENGLKKSARREVDARKRLDTAPEGIVINTSANRSRNVGNRIPGRSGGVE